MKHSTLRHSALALLLVCAFAVPHAQQAPAPAGKKVLGVEDYTKWRTITGQELSSTGERTLMLKTR